MAIHLAGEEYLNMSDLNTNCPSGWRFLAPNDGVAEAEVAILAVTPFFSQSQLYGSVRGYQFDDPDGFETYHEGRATTIETVPMLLVSVSLMALLDNTSGHLQLELLRVERCLSL